ncbi:MAG: PrsW family intramembrane metalloprotease [Leptospiraceae bacterium]|nr:PrsW family intramembrane metalloprotease [Leptospiraceae bacterium]
MSILVLLVLAVVPGVLLLLFFYLKDTYQREPWLIVAGSFLLGAIITIPIAFLEMALLSDTHQKSWPVLAMETFLIIALLEELGKYLVLRFYAARKPEFNEIFDGLVYGAAAASGFATFENLFYVLGEENGLYVGLLRAVLTIPMHIFTGALIGYWLARGLAGQAPVLLRLGGGLVTAIATHGLFDFVLFLDGPGTEYASVIAVPVVLYLLLLMILAVRYSRRHPEIWPLQTEPLAVSLRTAPASGGPGSVVPRLRWLFLAITWTFLGTSILFMGRMVYVIAFESVTMIRLLAPGVVAATGALLGLVFYLLARRSSRQLPVAN